MPVGPAVYKTLGVDPHLGKVSLELNPKKNPRLKKGFLPPKQSQFVFSRNFIIEHIR